MKLKKEVYPKVIIDTELCKGCALCIHYCPKNCIVMGEGFNSRGYFYAIFVDEESCTACGICANMCPDVAIEVWKR